MDVFDNLLHLNELIYNADHFYFTDAVVIFYASKGAPKNEWQTQTSLNTQSHYDFYDVDRARILTVHNIEVILNAWDIFNYGSGPPLI